MKKGKLILLIAAVALIGVAGFFVFTSTMSSPTTMKIERFKDKGDANQEITTSTLTLVLLDKDIVYSYYGKEFKNGKRTSLANVRDVIKEGVNKFSTDSLRIVIKPTLKATYKNTIDILDEMTINGIKNYSMNDPSKEEESLAKGE